LKIGCKITLIGQTYCTFAALFENVSKFFYIMGMTGFDSKEALIVSMPGNENVARYQLFSSHNWRQLQLRSRSIIEVQ